MQKNKIDIFDLYFGKLKIIEKKSWKKSKMVYNMRDLRLDNFLLNLNYIINFSIF